MKKILTILIIILGLLLVLSVGAYIAIRVYLTPANMRNLAQRLATEGIKYPVEIGRVSLNFGWKIGVTIDDIAIPNPPGFPNEPMIKIDKTRLNLKLLPLLRRQIVIGSIDLTGLDANITRNRSDQVNTLPLMPKETQGKGGAWKLSLTLIHLNKCRIKYADELQNLTVLVGDLNQAVSFKGSNISAIGEQTVLIPKNKSRPELKVRVRNSVEYDTLNKNIAIRKLTVQYEMLTLNATGTVLNQDRLDIKADLNVDDLAKLMPMIPENERPRKLAGSLRTKVAVTGTVKNPQVRGQAELSGIAVELKGLAKPVENIRGSLAFDPNSISAIKIQGQLAGTKFGLTGAVADLKNPILDLAFQLNGNLRDLEGLSEDAKGVAMVGVLDIKGVVKGSSKNPAYSGDINLTAAQIDGIGLGKPLSNFRFKGSVSNNAVRIWECAGNIGKSDFSLTATVSNFKKPVIQIANVSQYIDLDEMLPKSAPGKAPAAGKPLPITIQGTTKVTRLSGMEMEFKNINTNLNYASGIVDLKNCSADAFDGRVLFDFYYNANRPEPYRLISRMENLSTQKVFKRFLKFEAVEGRLNGVSNFQGSGFSQSNVIANLSATGSLKLTNGMFKNFKFITDLLGWMGFKNSSQLPINDLVCNFKIMNGKAEVNDWALASSMGNFLFNGTIGLTGSVNLSVTATLTKEQSDLLKKYHADWVLYYDPNGRAIVDALVTGKLTAPGFSLDKKKIEERLKGRIKDEFDKKKKELENKLKDLWKKK